MMGRNILSLSAIALVAMANPLFANDRGSCTVDGKECLIWSVASHDQVNGVAVFDIENKTETMQFFTAIVIGPTGRSVSNFANIDSKSKISVKVSGVKFKATTYDVKLTR